MAGATGTSTSATPSATPFQPGIAPLTWSDVVAPVHDNTSGKEVFRWEVDFSTGARNVWLVQHLVNNWDVDRCDRKPYGGWTAGTDDVTSDYWEAWWIDDSSDIRIPTSTDTPQKTTNAPAGADDKWVRQPARADEPTRGFWYIAAELYTLSALPAEFKIRGVPDAKHLASTAVKPSGNLTSPLATREIGGLWNFCDPANPWHHRV